MNLEADGNLNQAKVVSRTVNFQRRNWKSNLEAELENRILEANSKIEVGRRAWTWKRMEMSWPKQRMNFIKCISSYENLRLIKKTILSPKNRHLHQKSLYGTIQIVYGKRFDLGPIGLCFFSSLLSPSISSSGDDDTVNHGLRTDFQQQEKADH